MSRTGVAIPEKLFFKIGEVCELAGVQAHVLRYWESEFPMLAPQKNRAGQRVYRKRDVEMALRIKDLLYEDQYTIAGAKKRLASDLQDSLGRAVTMLVSRITFTIDAGNATTTPAGLPGWGPRQMNPISVEGSGSVRRRMSDKLQFVARNDKLKLIEHQTDPLPSSTLI